MLDSIDTKSKLTSQLRKMRAAREGVKARVIYNTSGARLFASVIKNDLLLDSGLYYNYTLSELEAHYLCAIFNANFLQHFFREECRSGDRHFHTAPPRLLPIPKFDSTDKVHSKLAELSVMAHDYVETQQDEISKIGNYRKSITKRNKVLGFPVIQNILVDMDTECVKIFPDYVEV